MGQRNRGESVSRCIPTSRSSGRAKPAPLTSPVRIGQKEWCERGSRRNDCRWFARRDGKYFNGLLASAPSEPGHGIHFHGEVLIREVGHHYAAATIDARRMRMDLKKTLATT